MAQTSEIITLRSGDLELLYGNGEIRQVRIGGFLLISSIYGAVRDQNWDTLPYRISNESIQSSKDGFLLGLELEYGEDQVLFQAQIKIVGSGNKLVFRYEGLALSSFQKNRIGLCILHPIEENKGKELEVFHRDGTHTKGLFPVDISPDQPFINMTGMKWTPGPHLESELLFEGDVFEMEDQRNWTDLSYKTYCTPLEHAFPVQVETGWVVKQSVTLRVRTSENTSLNTVSKPETLSLSGETRAALPAIGVARCSGPDPLGRQEANILKEIPFSHYRVDLHLNQSKWKEIYNNALEEQEMLAWPLELALFFGENPLSETDAFIRHQTSRPAKLKHLLIYDAGSLTVDPQMQEVIPRLIEAIPGIPIGGGSDGYFADLNRNHPPGDLLDFMAYSICPQVHAFDKLTLIENLEGQSETVRSALAQFQKPVYIPAITLKQRSGRADSRQTSVFAAGWTLGSFRQLTKSGTSSLTYFETVGPRGIVSRIKNKNKFCPTWYLFKEILGGGYTHLRALESSHPLRFDGVVLESPLNRLAILANYTGSDVLLSLQDVHVLPGSISMLTPDGWASLSKEESAQPHMRMAPEGVYKLKLQQ